MFFPDKNGKDASDSNYSSVEDIKETAELPVRVEPSPEHSDPLFCLKMASPASKMDSPASNGLPNSSYSEQEHETLDPESGGMTGKWSDDNGPDTTGLRMMALDLTGPTPGSPQWQKLWYYDTGLGMGLSDQALAAGPAVVP